MTDEELRGLLARVTEARQGLDDLGKDGAGDAALQERMAALYMEIEDCRREVEKARRAATPQQGGLMGILAWIVAAEPAKPDLNDPKLRLAMDDLTRRENELEEVNASFRKLRAAREDLKGRLDVLADGLRGMKEWDGAALRTRFLALADAAAYRSFAGELLGGAFLELIEHAARNVDGLKQIAIQVDALMRMVETTAANASSTAPTSMLSSRRADPTQLNAALNDSLERIRTRTWPDLQALVARAETGFALIGIVRAAPTPDPGGAGSAPVGVGVAADAYRLRYDLQMFARGVTAFRTAAEAEVKALIDQRGKLEKGADEGGHHGSAEGTEEKK